MRCPCFSGKSYKECCKPYHEGTAAENALILMRSRYAAYALGLADYIIKTTHRTNPHTLSDLAAWKTQILDFSKNTQFVGLTIVEFTDGEIAYVTFTAHLKQGNRDVSFTEKSRFLKENGFWTYQSGIRA